MYKTEKSTQFYYMYTCICVFFGYGNAHLWLQVDFDYIS